MVDNCDEELKSIGHIFPGTYMNCFYLFVSIKIIHSTKGNAFLKTREEIPRMNLNLSKFRNFWIL